MAYRDRYILHEDAEETSQETLFDDDPKPGDIYRDKRSGTFICILAIVQRRKVQWLTVRRNDRVTDMPRHWLDEYWEKAPNYRVRPVE